MKEIKSIDEYFTLLKEAKQSSGRLFTNSYLSIPTIERYINLKRLYYLKQEKGIIFLCDEEKYYRLLYWLDVKCEIHISKMDKPIAIRNIYKEGKKKEELLCIEKQLEDIRFEKEYVAIEMRVPLEQSEFIAKQSKLHERMLKKGKFHIACMKEENIEQMLAMREAKEFHIYNFDYRSREEYCAEIANEQYIAVYNDVQEMCACIYTELLPTNMTGNGICVKEEYKQTFGLGAALMCHVLDKALNVQGKKYVSWCEKENVNSMKFHKSMGFENTGKISEEWILK